LPFARTRIQPPQPRGGMWIERPALPSAREGEVLAAIAAGDSSKRIARRRGGRLDCRPMQPARPATPGASG